MTETYFISDTHFGHRNMLNFKRDDGKPLRPFIDVEDMDNTMIENWNSIVKPQDKVYHLGDVVMARSQLKTLAQLNGRKVLIKGNHDICKIQDYLNYFEDVRAYKVYPNYGIICSHIPLHAGVFTSRWKVNVHGHLHANLVRSEQGFIDHRYVNISVEQIDYAPITFDELLSRCGLERIHNELHS